jgi:hypothetical protein
VVAGFFVGIVSALFKPKRVRDGLLWRLIWMAVVSFKGRNAQGDNKLERQVGLILLGYQDVPVELLARMVQGTLPGDDSEQVSIKDKPNE